MKKRIELDWKAPLRGAWAEENYYIPPRLQWFYRLKAFICWNLELEPPIKANLYDGVRICYTDGGTSYVPGEVTIYWFEAIVVGHGVFSNWWATTCQDSN